MARKSKEQQRITELECALRDLLNAARMYQYTPPEVITRAVAALSQQTTK